MHEMISQLKLMLLELFAYRGKVRIGLPIYDKFHRCAVEFCTQFNLYDDSDWKRIERHLLHCEAEYLTSEKASEINTALSRIDSRLRGTQALSLDQEKVLYDLLHPRVAELSRPRMEAGCCADAVECVLKEINCRVKKIVLQKTNEEMDGVPLMQKAFSGDEPLIRLEASLETQSSRDIQRGYQFLFAGAMGAIRNPKAHDNIKITKQEAFRFLMFASILMTKLDKSI